MKLWTRAPEFLVTGPSTQASALQSLGNVGDLGKVVPTAGEVVHEWKIYPFRDLQGFFS